MVSFVNVPCRLLASQDLCGVSCERLFCTEFLGRKDGTRAGRGRYGAELQIKENLQKEAGCLVVFELYLTI